MDSAIRLRMEKPLVQDADSIPVEEGNTSNHVKREWIDRSCVVVRTRAR